MEKKEYEQKKIESWEKYNREVIKVKWQNSFSVFCDAFDRGYALDKQEKDADGEEMLTVSRKRVHKMFAEAKETMPICEHDRGFRNAELSILRTLFGSDCMPDGDNQSPEPKPAVPRYKKDQKVIWRHEKCWVYDVGENERGFMYIIIVEVAGGAHTVMEYELDPYYESKDPDFEPLSAETVELLLKADEEYELRKLSQNTANCDKDHIVQDHEKVNHIADTRKMGDRIKENISARKRLNIAAMAMQGILSNQHIRFMNHVAIADCALAYADALIKQSEKGGTE